MITDAELGNFGEGDPIAVSSILHKAVVNVDKEGTEGAAATGVELVLLSGSFGEKTINFFITSSKMIDF